MKKQAREHGDGEKEGQVGGWWKVWEAGHQEVLGKGVGAQP